MIIMFMIMSMSMEMSSSCLNKVFEFELEFFKLGLLNNYKRSIAILTLTSFYHKDIDNHTLMIINMKIIPMKR